MEVYAGATPQEIARLDELMDSVCFEVTQTSEAIMKRAAHIRGDSIRRGHKIAPPAAIIQATAVILNLQVITRNKKDFKGPNICISYELVTRTTVEIVNATPPGAT